MILREETKECRISPLWGRVQTPDWIRKFMSITGGFFTFVLISLFILPWQQTSPGTGRVVARGPTDRQQGIQSPISGRVVHWHVREGSKVKKGDAIVEMSDIDPDFISRLGQERSALESRLDAARSRAESIQSRISSLQLSVESSITAASNRARMADDRTRQAQQALDAAEIQLRTSLLNLNRQKSLLEKGLTSQRNYELAELDFTNALTGKERASAVLDAAVKDQKALAAELERVRNEGKATLNDARAQLAAARGDVARTYEEIPRLEARQSRQSSQEIVSPRDGIVVRILKPDGMPVKDGETLAIIIPAAEDNAVELFVSGNDIPLIAEGRKVRLQFQGWPALQIAGWPEVAVGTFGGIVQLVDVTDNGSGNFRVLVVPDPADDEWPSSRFLRQGVRAKGWIFLNRVSLAFELWRKFNDFPPAIPMDEPESRKELNEKAGDAAK